MGNRARRLRAPDHDAAALLPDLRQVESTQEASNLARALALAKPLLSGSRGSSELVFLTDNHQAAWDPDALGPFAATAAPGVQVRVIDVGVGAVANGWIVGARVVETGDIPHPLLRIELAASGGEPQERTLRVAGIPGEPDAARSVTLEPGQPMVLHLELPADRLRGQMAKITLDPPDVLPDDDEFFVALDPCASLRVLLIAPDTNGPISTRPGFALRTAVKSLTDSGIRSSRSAVRSPTTVSSADLGEADVVLLADVPELPESSFATLCERVRAGAGLAVFLGPRVRSEWYNQNLFRPLQPTEGLLPFEIGTVISPVERAPWLLASRPPALLAGLGDPLIGDLAEVSSARYHRLGGAMTESANLVARVEDGTPVLVEHRIGAGNVLLVNASPDDAFSDLPNSKVFVPFMDRLLASLGRNGGRAFTTGEPLALPLDRVRPGETVALIGPGDERRPVVVRGGAGRGILELGSLDRSGAYRVEGGDMSPLVFTVNADRRDSALSPADPVALRSWWQPLHCTVESSAEARERKSSRESWPLWPCFSCWQRSFSLWRPLWRPGCARGSPPLRQLP